MTQTEAHYQMLHKWGPGAWTQCWPNGMKAVFTGNERLGDTIRFSASWEEALAEADSRSNAEQK